MPAIANNRFSKRARELARFFLSDARAATSIEYALIAVIVSISILASGQLLRDQLIIVFGQVVAGFAAALGG
jgi:Flp pilus assembly pilin Flp